MTDEARGVRPDGLQTRDERRDGTSDLRLGGGGRAAERWPHALARAVQRELVRGGRAFHERAAHLVERAGKEDGRLRRVRVQVDELVACARMHECTSSSCAKPEAQQWSRGGRERTDVADEPERVIRTPAEDAHRLLELERLLRAHNTISCAAVASHKQRVRN